MHTFASVHDCIEAEVIRHKSDNFEYAVIRIKTQDDGLFELTLHSEAPLPQILDSGVPREEKAPDDELSRLAVEDAYYEIVRQREPESFVEED